VHEDKVICQIIISWPYRPNFLGREDPVDTPASNDLRVQWIKEITSHWIEPFRSIVHDIPEQGTDVKTISLEDWIPEIGNWDNGDGRVTLVGDAAHAMTMCMFYLSLHWPN